MGCKRCLTTSPIKAYTVLYQAGQFPNESFVNITAHLPDFLSGQQCRRASVIVKMPLVVGKVNSG